MGIFVNAVFASVSPFKARTVFYSPLYAPNPGTPYQLQAKAHHPAVCLVNSPTFDRVCCVGF